MFCLILYKYKHKMGSKCYVSNCIIFYDGKVLLSCVKVSVSRLEQFK